MWGAPLQTRVTVRYGFPGHVPKSSPDSNEELGETPSWEAIIKKNNVSVGN
jgi:hypothetical protein